jgi:predicted transglutaminase-like cysteine proteinase
MTAILGLLAALLGTGLAHAATPSIGTVEPSYFGSTEIENTRIAPFTKWTDMLARYHAEEVEDAGPCRPTPILPCFHADWLKLLAGLKSRPVMEQLDVINRTMNRHPYITDPVNWGVPDYWAAPDQFLRKDGDCEDYAIAKYLSLRHLGFDADRLRIVVLQDLNLGVPHAVLIVFVNGTAMLLDNQISDVIPASAVHHYRPIYSINEKAWWLHKSGAANP